MEGKLLLAAVFGLLWGSFLNVLVARIPQGRPLLWGRSCCERCGGVLRWWELVPVASFLLLRGRCARCGARLSWREPVVELASGFLFFWAAWQAQTRGVLFWAEAVLLGAWGGLLLALALIDFRHQILPNGLVAAVAAGGALLAWLRGAGVGEMAGGAAVAAVVLGAIYLLTRGRGMGLGDVKLATALGLALGLPLVVFLFLLSFLCAGVWAAGLLALRRAKLKDRIAFGPFLAAAAWLVVIYAPFWHKFWQIVLQYW